MPNRADHLARATENEELAGSLNLDKACQVDWAITILFYAALQYVDAFLAGKNFHPRSHDSRDTEIGNNGSLNPIYADYRKLKDKSRAARYEVPNFHRNQLPQVEQQFQSIKSHVCGLLKPPTGKGGGKK